MKILVIGLFAGSLLFGQAQQGQTPEPVKITPGMPAVKVPGEAPEVAAVTPPPPVPPDTVVAEVNGKKITAAEMDKIIAGFPANNQPTLHTRPQLLGQVFLMQRLAEDAEKAGMDKQSPYKEQLDFYRLQLLSNAEMSQVNNTQPVTEEDQRKYYNDNPAKFKEVKLRVIYVAYTTAPTTTPAKPGPESKKRLTQAEALAKIQDLEKQIRDGGDFGKLARENSDDQVSAAKDGDFGVIKQDSAYPKEVKEALFALKQGEMSSPVKQPNGYYLVRAEEINQQPFPEAAPEIIKQIRQEHFQAWIKTMQAQYNVKVESPAYFAPRAPAQLQQVH